MKESTRISCSQWARAVGAEGRDRLRVNRLVWIAVSGGGKCEASIESSRWSGIGSRERGGRDSEERS